MATIFERANSRGARISPDPRQTEIELQYKVFGTEDDEEVRELVELTRPETYLGQQYQDYTIAPAGPDIWDVAVRYSGQVLQSIGQETYSFDFSGTTQHITRSLETVNRFGLVAPDYKGLIGVTKDGVDGCDVVVPQARFSESRIRSDNSIDTTYKRTIVRLIGKVNSAEFLGFERGEVLFLGASGSKRGDADWEITYHFAASLNGEVSVTMLGESDEDVIEVINKEGWHYMWFGYKELKDDDTNTLVKRIQSAYVERVYDYANFADLEIG